MKTSMDFYNNQNKKVGCIDFKNISDDVGEIYIYGEIISGSEKWDDSDVIVNEFKKNLDELGDIKTLNIFCNSPGGSVMSGVNILNILNRHKSTKNVYIDALAASICSVIIMCYDNLYIYPTSTIMVHEAGVGIFWQIFNKTELLALAERLERIEENMIIPAYMQKANIDITEDMFRNAMKKESWWGKDDIMRYFSNVTLIEEERDMVACANFDMLNQYHNLPNKFKTLINKQQNNPSPTLSDNTNNQKQKLKLQLDLL